MAKFKITVTAPFGKERPTFETVVEADTAKNAHAIVLRACQPGAKYVTEELPERRPTLRAAQ